MEATLLVGPPCCGQEAYYHHHYVGVARCSESAIDEIVGLIKEHKKVVIDNDHLEAEPRMAVVDGIKSQLPDCLVKCIDFIPQHEPIQCLWSLNWLFARNFMAMENDGMLNDLPLSKLKEQITSYSASRIALSLDLENFDSVVHLKSPLICSTHYKLTSPALLLEWRGIQYQERGASTSSDNSTQQQCILRTRIKTMCQLWRDSNRTGHVIVLCENTLPSASDAILPILSQLAEDSSAPIHCVMFPETISLKKNPLPWIQYVFHINLHHRASALVSQSKHYLSIGKEMGIRTLTIFQVSDRPRLVVSKHSSEMQVPLLLHSMEYALPPPSYSNQHMYTALPLFSRAKRMHESGREESNDSATSHVFADVHDIVKLRLVMLYHNYSELKSHEENCRQALVPVSEESAVEYTTIATSAIYSAKTPTRTPFYSLGSVVTVPVDYSDLPPPPAIPTLPTSTVTNTKRKRTLPLWLTEITESEKSQKKRKSLTPSKKSASKKPRPKKPVQVTKKSTLPPAPVPSPPPSPPKTVTLDDIFTF